MKKILLSTLMILSVLCCQALEASANSWPKEISVTWRVQADGTVTATAMIESNIRDAWAEVNKLVSEINHVPNAMVSPEYVLYRSGSLAFGAPSYYLTRQELNESFKNRAAQTPEERKQSEDAQDKADAAMKANPWLTLIQPKDTKETNCLAMAVVNGKPQGCGDVWQGGIKESDMACWKNRTYVRCHLECIEKLYNKKLDLKAGPCQASNDK